MANHKSALKRARQNEIRRLRNKSSKTRVKSVVKEVRMAGTDDARVGLSPDLAATMPGHLHYALCVTTGLSEVERCSYMFGYTLIRQRFWWKVALRDARTGAWIAGETFYGTNPASCPLRYSFGTSRIKYRNGSSPPPGDVSAWLRKIIR